MKRRTFLQALACLSITGLDLKLPANANAQTNALAKRQFGRINFDVTTFGLGGQASIQKTPSDIDPVEIIVKAYNMGVNYFDTSNAYQESQSHFGKAFKQLGLVIGQPNYNAENRKKVFLTSKTGLRWANENTYVDGVRSFSNNGSSTSCVSDIKRTMTQVFGDGRGNYPKGAYIDMMLMHSIDNMETVDALYEGYDGKHPSGRVGTFAVLRDYRDGTNITGYNPQNEKLIRHIGFSGQRSPAVLMYMIQKDTQNLLDGLLVAINPNDKLYFNMQNNVIPVAKAKGMGVIGMKVFSNGVMYGRNPGWGWSADENIRTIGNATLPSHLPIQYALTTPGIDTVIVGIGHISDNKNECQLYQNILASQIAPNGLTEKQRADIEKITKHINGGNTNYFQTSAKPLSAPRNVELKTTANKQGKSVQIEWQTAYAGDAPINHYQIWRDGIKIADVPHKPQISFKPFVFNDNVADTKEHKYKIATVDKNNQTVATDIFTA